MRIAFCLFNYFPFGGLQKDFLSIALACQQRGHEITVFTLSWEGAVPAGFQVNKINVAAVSNHQRCIAFSKKLKKQLVQQQFDVVVGFNKMPGLDFYYAADGCFQAKIRYEKNWLYCLTPRYRKYMQLEKSVFDKNKTCQIFMLNAREAQHFSHYYHTEQARLHFLPPGISDDCVATPDANLIANEMRDRFSIAKDEQLLLMVASDFKTK